MNIISNALPSLASIPIIMANLLSIAYSPAILAHDPGLSMIDIEAADNTLSAHITYPIFAAFSFLSH